MLIAMSLCCRHQGSEKFRGAPPLVPMRTLDALHQAQTRDHTEMPPQVQRALKQRDAQFFCILD